MNEAKQIELKIEIDDSTAQGMYSNLALISHSDTEFIFDFVFVQPQEPKGKVRARIILTPLHAKRFLQALTENVEKFEAKHGIIQGDFGFPQKTQLFPC